MSELKLVAPSLEYGNEIMAFRQELIDADDFDSFAGCGCLRECDTIEKYLEIIKALEQEETTPYGVPSHTYLAVRIRDNRVVGIIDLRHHINHPVLSVWGGHMGYSIRPSERGKGYATEMLKQNLEHCRDRNLKKVMITCSKTNVASEKVILANGGVFEKEVCVDDDIIKRYWITL